MTGYCSLTAPVNFFSILPSQLRLGPSSSSLMRLSKYSGLLLGFRIDVRGYCES